MRIVECTIQDGKSCAHLINLMRAGKWNLSGDEMTLHTDAVRWLFSLANEMAKNLKDQPGTTPAAAPGFKIKSIGTLPGKPSKKIPKKRKG